MLNPIIVPPVDDIFSQFMLDCQRALKTIPGIDPNLVFIGHKEFYADQEFYTELNHTPFEFFVGPCKGKGDLWTKNGDFDCVLEIYYTIPKDKSNSLIPMMKMISYVNQALSTSFINWDLHGNRQPRTLDWEYPMYKYHEKNFVVTTVFNLHSKYIVDQCSQPFLVPPASVVTP